MVCGKNGQVGVIARVVAIILIKLEPGFAITDMIVKIKRRKRMNHVKLRINVPVGTLGHLVSLCIN